MKVMETQLKKTIERILLDKSMKKADLAKKMGITLSSLSQLLNTVGRIPNKYTLEKLANSLEIDIEELNAVVSGMVMVKPTSTSIPMLEWKNLQSFIQQTNHETIISHLKIEYPVNEGSFAVKLNMSIDVMPANTVIIVNKNGKLYKGCLILYCDNEDIYNLGSLKQSTDDRLQIQPLDSEKVIIIDRRNIIGVITESRLIY